MKTCFCFSSTGTRVYTTTKKNKIKRRIVDKMISQEFPVFLHILFISFLFLLAFVDSKQNTNPLDTIIFFILMTLFTFGKLYLLFVAGVVLYILVCCKYLQFSYKMIYYLLRRHYITQIYINR